MSVTAALRELENARASLRCTELARLLKSMGFEVREGKKPGHKIFHHPGLRGFWGGSYTCGHGRNPQVKPVYIRNILRLIRQYEDELRTLFEGDRK